MNRDRLVELLYDRIGGFWRVDELSSTCGMDIPSLRSAIGQLEADGFTLEHSPARGVRMVRPVPPDSHLIMRNLDTRRVGRDVICFDTVDSTNDVALGASCGQDADGLVVVANFQSKGRGRLGRQWFSPPGANVLMSLLLCDPPACPSHETLTIMVGLAVAEAIEETSHSAPSRVGLKWPNDVLIDDAKVAGVLVEVRHGCPSRAMVTGIGINATAAPQGVGAGRLSDFFTHPVERVELIRTIIRRLDNWLENITSSGPDALHAPWKSRCQMINNRLRVRSSGRDYVGRVLDVSPLEGLVMACDDGRQVHLPAERTTVLDGKE